MVMSIGAAPLAILGGGSALGVVRSQAGRYALPGTSIGSIDVSGLSAEEAQVRLLEHWQDYIRNPVELGYGGTRWTPTANEIGIIVDIERALQEVFSWERRRMWFWFSGLSGQNHVEMPVFLNSSQALAFLEAIAPQIDREPVNSLLDRQANQIHLVPGNDGKWLDREATLGLMRLPADPPVRQVVELPVETRPPPITLQRAEAVKTAFERLVTEGLRFELDGDSWQLPGNTLNSWLQIYQDPEQGMLEVMGEPKMLGEWLGRVSEEATRPAKNARFTVGEGGVSVTTPAKPGFIANADTLLATAQTAIQQGLTALYVPAEVQEPMYTAANMQDWDFQNILAEGVSVFKGSPPERSHNIALAATKLHGYVIPPGETFSFLSTLGPITRQGGYQSSLIIFGDQTVPGVGGGVCQVSTTMFRAAFWAGLPITERNQHSYRVSYYERDGSPPGFDAAVYDPGVDLKFVNDSENPILIQTHVDEEAMELKFVFHGRSANRWVRMLPAVAKNWVPHGPPLPDKEDHTLPFGERQQIEWAIDGVDAEIRREVVVDEQSRFDSFRSHYQPWQERWLVGTRIDPPEQQLQNAPQPQG